MILGMDEAGRGAWAGPVVVGAVVLDENKPIDGLADSKILTKIQRDHLSQKIYAQAHYVGIGMSSPEEIDSLGLSRALTLAYERAVADCPSKITSIIIDGNVNFLSRATNVKCIIRADQTVLPVCAASIVAKVYRDNYMTEISKAFPVYGFESHVGYGTTKHIDALKKYGIIETLHRKSYRPIRGLMYGAA